MDQWGLLKLGLGIERQNFCEPMKQIKKKKKKKYISELTAWSDNDGNWVNKFECVPKNKKQNKCFKHWVQ